MQLKVTGKARLQVQTVGQRKDSERLEVVES